MFGGRGRTSGVNMRERKYSCMVLIDLCIAKSERTSYHSRRRCLWRSENARVHAIFPKKKSTQTPNDANATSVPQPP
jgi:hypothetical protein